MEESSQDKTTVISRDNDVVEGEVKRLNKLGKCRSRSSKLEYPLDSGADADGDFTAQGGVTSSREEKVSSLKTVSTTILRLHGILSLCICLSIGIFLKLLDFYTALPTLLHDTLVTCLKALVHVARKMPKNAHAHFILGLMYQRLGQPSKVAFVSLVFLVRYLSSVVNLIEFCNILGNFGL